jgi:ABC-type dipeptide/oligopeptide/nickel transport system permease subunit
VRAAEELTTGTPTGGQETPGTTGRSYWLILWLRFRRDRGAMFGLACIGFFFAMALLAPLVSRMIGHGPNELFLTMRTPLGLPKGPTRGFPFGADQVGRDVFVRCLYGARTALIVALLGTAAATVIGVAIGIVAGLYGGWLDTVVSRTIDVWLSLPLLLFAIGLATVCSSSPNGCLGGALQPGLSLVIGIIALFSWPYIARIVRGQVITLRNGEFVEAARSLGASNGRIVFAEMLPNLMAPILVYATLTLPGNVLFEAALSFLGVGVPQSTPSWGRMLSDASSGSLFTYAWWMVVFPGGFLLLMTFAFYMVGDGLRRAIDPRSPVR